jgi:RNA polymerase sigma-70 factor, ECF subfamily
MTSPQDVVTAARRGEGAALAALYREHGVAAFRLAYHLTGTREDAEDVVHDVFVGLPEALRRYEERGRLESWLKRVVARVALMRLRQRGRRREVALDAVADHPSPEASTDHATLRDAVAALPDALRAVLVLKEIEGYSHAEVGALLGISAGASRARLLRAITRLRRTLGEDR